MGSIEKLMKNRQVILLIIGLFPGILAATKIISGGQATLSLIVLFVISRRFANATQNKFELEEAERVAREQRLATQSKKKGKGKGKDKGKDYLSPLVAMGLDALLTEIIVPISTYFTYRLSTIPYQGFLAIQIVQCQKTTPIQMLILLSSCSSSTGELHMRFLGYLFGSPSDIVIKDKAHREMWKILYSLVPTRLVGCRQRYSHVSICRSKLWCLFSV